MKKEDHNEDRLVAHQSRKELIGTGNTNLLAYLRPCYSGPICGHRDQDDGEREQLPNPVQLGVLYA